MPHTADTAQALLDEFMAKRQGKPIPRYKARVRGSKLLSFAPMPLEKAEFEPDNSRIGRESRGLQSGYSVRVGHLLCMGLVDAAARAMVEDWIDAARGLVPQYMVCTVVQNSIGE